MLPDMKGIKCILLDIEGTVCPISFVKDTLFPYALNALPEVLASKWNDEEFKVYRDAFPEAARESPQTLQAHVEDLTKRDVKIASLKNLQGYLWENGYKTGAYSTPLFPDVAPQLKQWKNHRFQLAIYSSGSVFAQKLLFGHVNTEAATGEKRKRPNGVENDIIREAHEPPAKKRTTVSDSIRTENHTTESSIDVDGSETAQHQDTSVTKANSTSKEADISSDVNTTEDLQHLITDWFDTTNAGLKTESASYEKIANVLKWSPVNIVFLSDNVKEVDAAATAGMQSIMVDRPGNAPLSDEDRDRLHGVTSFNEIILEQDATGSKSNARHSAKPGERRSKRLKAKGDSER